MAKNFRSLTLYRESAKPSPVGELARRLYIPPHTESLIFNDRLDIFQNVQYVLLTLHKERPESLCVWKSLTHEMHLNMIT